MGEFYAGMASLGLGYGPSFQGVERVWGGAGVARGEIAAPEGVADCGVGLHPTVLDACFQVLMAALPEAAGDPYVPLGWESLELWERAPRRVLCEARLREGAADTAVADLWLRDAAGAAFGRVRGLLLKRATRQALLGAAAGVDELLYEVVWREVAAPAATAEFLAGPAEVGALVAPRLETLAAGVGFEAGREARLEALLEQRALGYALAGLRQLGWSPVVGEAVEAAALRDGLGVLPEHTRLFARLLALLGEVGLLSADGSPGRWRVAAPDLPTVSDEGLSEAELEGSIAWALLSRCGASLAAVLRGEVAPLRLLFPEQGVGAADLYREAPVFRLTNAALAKAVERAVAGLPPGRRLRVLEVGAGTGGATASLLPLLPRERTDYAYTDVSAGFFSAAEERFGPAYPFVSYRVLDIEREPQEQGFAACGYDLVVASNVLHATRDVTASARHCRSLLAPSGELALLEVMEPRGWHDLTFGLLEGWWRFADSPLRSEHALLNASDWRRALEAAGFADVTILRPAADAGPGVVLARSPSAEQPGLWLLAADAGGTADRLAAGLAARGQRVVMARPGAELALEAETIAGVEAWRLRTGETADWRELLARLPVEPPLRGVAHLAALDAAAAGSEAATTERLATDAEAVVGGALALTQALLGLGAPPTAGLWLVTEGAQVVAGEPGGRLIGAALWGLGRTLAREHPELGVRRLDLEADTELAALLDELLAPDGEDEASRRGTARLAPRLVRAGSETERLALPSEAGWRLARGSERTLAGLHVERVTIAPPGPGEVAVALEAAGLNFRDVLDTLGLVPVDAGPLGLEFAGRIVAVGADVKGFAPGDRVVGLGSGCFGDRVTTPAALVARLPAALAPAAAATLPSVFVTAALAFELASLRRGDRVLVHAGAGGVGLAAIQLAHAAGAEVFATASAAKRGYLRGLGVEHVHDSRSTGFAAEILAATGGRGVDVVLNSLTGEGFIAASLSALVPGGRFVEIAKRDIWSAGTMSAARPDVVYHILAVDRLIVEEPDRIGSALRSALERMAAGELQALPYVSYPLSEARLAMRRMQQARHIGKIVLTPPAAATVRAGATYLITGGLGGIGLAVAGWLADRGASHIALNGRRAPNAAAAAAVAALRARGVTVEVIQADVAKAAEVDRLLAEIEARMPPLAGVIHSVGLLRDGAVANQDWSRFAEVLNPKVLGGWRLHCATLHRPLELFVLFASTAGLLGSRGQANHAAANVFLDQLARCRRALGLPGLSVDWGAWSEIGEAAERRAALEASLAAAGIGWIAPAQGLAALGRALAGEAAQLAVAAVDWNRVPPAPFLGELLAADRARRGRPRAAAAEPPIAQRLARTPPAQRQADLVAWLGQAMQTVLRLPEPPDASIGFSALGMDSLMAVELRNRLNAQLRLDPPLPATILFDTPNLSALAQSIQQRLGLNAKEEEEEEKPTSRPAVSSNALDRPEVAIVGMACRFPLAPDLGAYWRLLMEGTDAIVRIPTGRLKPIPEAGAGAEMAGLLDEIADFDPSHFGISHNEAPYIDPQHRLLLEATWHALENAGIAPIKLSGSRTGVFIGIGAADFAAQHANDLRVLSVYSGLGSGSFAAANRVSYVFGFTGPSFAVNTACASSLTALHLAVTSLQADECDLAVVGGVNLLLHSSEFVSLSKAEVLSQTGRCRSFSSDADGYVRGEGCGVVVLRRLGDAMSAGDRIAAVIKGSAISHVGASNGMSAPNGPAQEAVMRAAAAKAGIDLASIEYLEAQGTGTPLGDAIEMGAIHNAMAQRREPANPLRIGTVKTNIGNLEEASGMAALIKTILAMQHGVIPSTLHFRGFNQYIRIGSAPIRMVDRPESWLRAHGARRTAAVNGFGYGGANAHVILQEAPPAEHDVDEPHLPYVLAMSARTPTALRTLARLYANAVSRCRPADVQTFCTSANTGRGDLGYRLAVIGTDREALESRLRVAGEGNSAPGIFRLAQRSKRKPRVGFLFSGRESLDEAPVSDLYRDEPVFREVIDRCAAIHGGTGDTALYELLIAPGAGQLARARDAEPALFALQSALAALWDSWGIRPDYLLGEGTGELAAAACAGALNLEDGMRLVIERARLTDRLDAQSDRAEAVGKSSHDLQLEQFEAFATSIQHRDVKRQLFSTMVGVPVPKETEAWPRYWREHIRRPVDVLAALRRLGETDCDVFVEIGPNANLVNLGREHFVGRKAMWLASLQTGSLLERAALVEAVAGLYVAGCPVDFVALHRGRGGPWDDVPLYPFERQRYWLDEANFSAAASGMAETLKPVK